MRAPFVALVVLAVPVALAGLPSFTACSSVEGAAADASLGALQPPGAACDPALPNACAPGTSTCTANLCISGLCTTVPSNDPTCGDANGIPPTNTLCASSADCDGGVCGFLAGAGCGVTGVCVTPLVSALPAACGCDGLPDPYVGDGFTARPASSPAACSDGGLEDGAVDAGADSAAIDAGGSDSAAEAGDASPQDAASE